MKTIYLVLLSILSGLLLALSWPVNGFTPLVFIALVPLLFVQQYLGDSNKKGMFWLAWLAFLIWNVLTTWWIWYSTSVGSVAAFVLNALFTAIVFQLFHLSKKWFYQNKKGSWILIFYWISWEYFHLNWDLSWSWLNLGNAFASTPKIIQWYEYTGTFGGGLWILIVNVLIFTILNKFVHQRSFKGLYINTIVLVLVIVVPIIYSVNIYNNYLEKGKEVDVVVVQPNIDPYNEQYNLSPDSILSRNLALAIPLVDEKTKYVVMPESALQEDIWVGALNNSTTINSLFATAKNFDSLTFITGATTYKMIRNGDEKTNAARKFRSIDKYYYAYNSALLVDNRGFVQLHHKSKLTPGVEIMPSWGILKPIESLAVDLGGTTGTLGRDKDPVVFWDLDSIGSSPIICYESIYGEFVTETVKKGGMIIFVITNDGWWGNTPGHKQHLLFSSLRAIETRRWVARSANTGISAFINERGDVLQRTKYWEPAVLKQTIRANDELTYYVKNGDYLATTSAFISVMVFLIALTQGFLRKKKGI
ncbi:MAG: apolipoprotein N-acyltransferase [Marinilabiliales bacterium]|nr:MAG: apolipoprotein N-acyltransferase [Marinilabiliales bacterium]